MEEDKSKESTRVEKKESHTVKNHIKNRKIEAWYITKSRDRLATNNTNQEDRTSNKQDSTRTDTTRIDNKEKPNNPRPDINQTSDTKGNNPPITEFHKSTQNNLMKQNPTKQKPNKDIQMM